MKKVICAVFLLTSFSVFARDLYVNGSQSSDNFDGLSWEYAKQTIQSAVNCAENGDTIWVTNGVYNVFSVTNLTSLSIVGVNGARATIIDGKMANRCAKLPESVGLEIVTLSGFTLCNGRALGSGSAGRGGGIYGGEIHSCVISNNLAGIGGGTYNASLYNCLIVHNSAQTGGGVYGKVIDACTVANNVADYMAGGISSCSATGSLIWNNYTGDELENYDGMSIIQYSCVSPAEGSWNEDLIPLFVNEGLDYRLLYGSPTTRGYDSNLYTVITFDPENGSENNFYDVVCNTYNILPTPVRVGDFGFAGWWTTNGVEVTSGMPLVWLEAHTLNARWVYTVHNAFSAWGNSWDSGGDVVWKPSEAVGLYGHPVFESCNTNAYQESWVEASGLTGSMVRVYWRPVQTNEYWMSDYPLIKINDGIASQMLPYPSQDGFSSGWNIYETSLNSSSENQIKIIGVGTHAIQVALVSLCVPINVYSRSYDPTVYYFYQGTPYLSNDSFASMNSQYYYWYYSDSLIGWSTNVVGQESLINPMALVTLKANDALYGQYAYWPDVNLVLGTKNLVWETGGDVPWNMDNENLFSGVVMRSGYYLGDNQSSWLQTTVSGPCMVSFMWKVSSEGGYDWLTVSLDGTHVQSISGDKNIFPISGSSSYLRWQQVKISVPAGHHQIRWTYATDSSTTTGSNCGWIDDVQVGPVGYVTLDAQGGTVYPAQIEVGDGAPIGSLPVPQRDGYLFQGWWTSPQGGQQVSQSTVFSGADSVIFYARWSVSAVSTLGDWSYDALLLKTWKTNQFATVMNASTQLLAKDPSSCELRILRAIATVANLAENNVLNSILARFGYSFGFSEMQFFGAYTPETAPPTNEMVDQIASEVLPVIDSALADLGYVPEDWAETVFVSSAVYPVDSDVYIDNADVLFFRTMLYAIKATITFAQAYDATLNYNSFNVKNQMPPVHEIQIDGSFDDWSAVPVDCGESANNRIAFTKVAYGATNVNVFAQIADGVEWSYFYCSIAMKNYFVSLQCNVDTSSFIEGEVYNVQGYLYNVFSWWYEYLDVRVCRKGNAFELAFPIPDGYAAELFKVSDLGVNYIEGGYGFFDFKSKEQPSKFASYWLNTNLLCASSIRNATALNTSRSSLKMALTQVIAADNAMGMRTGSEMHFFEYDFSDVEHAAIYEKLKTTVRNALLSMDQTVDFNTNGILEEASGVSLSNHVWSIKMGALFDAPYVVRSFLPRITENDAVFLDSITDPTFGGVFPSFSQSTWDSLLGSRVEVAKTLKDDSAQMRLEQNNATWIEWPITGTGTVTYCVSTVYADTTASLSTYIDGQKQSFIYFGSGVATQTLHFAECGAHTLRWKFSSRYQDPLAVTTIQILEVNGLQSVSEDVSVSVTTDNGIKFVVVPKDWLSEMYPSASLYSSSDFQQLAQSIGANGHSVWLSYILGLSPTNVLSKFIATIQIGGDGRPVISYSPQGAERISNVQYRIMGKTNLNDSQWEEQRDGHRFFKVEVILP